MCREPGQVFIKNVTHDLAIKMQGMASPSVAEIFPVWTFWAEFETLICDQVNGAAKTYLHLEADS